MLQKPMCRSNRLTGGSRRNRWLRTCPGGPPAQRRSSLRSCSSESSASSYSPAPACSAPAGTAVSPVLLSGHRLLGCDRRLWLPSVSLSSGKTPGAAVPGDGGRSPCHHPRRRLDMGRDVCDSRWDTARSRSDHGHSHRLVHRALLVLHDPFPWLPRRLYRDLSPRVPPRSQAATRPWRKTGLRRRRWMTDLCDPLSEVAPVPPNDPYD